MYHMPFTVCTRTSRTAGHHGALRQAIHLRCSSPVTIDHSPGGCWFHYKCVKLKDASQRHKETRL